MKLIYYYIYCSEACKGKREKQS